MKKILFPIIFVAIALSMGSCRLLNPSIMLRTAKDYQFDIPPVPKDSALYYRISPNDQITIQLFANDGFRLIDMTNIGGQGGGANMMMMMQQGGGFSYLIDPDGKSKLPIIGRTMLAGLTIREAELMLQEKYSEYYNNPFCLVTVLNRRVLMFTGNDGAGIVVPLTGENITVMEGLAMAGGIAPRGKAHKVKLIRNNHIGKPEVYLLDLSKIEGLEDARMVLQANDIIYVEPRLDLATDVLRELNPLLALVSTTFIIITAIQNVGN